MKSIINFVVTPTEVSANNDSIWIQIMCIEKHLGDLLGDEEDTRVQLVQVAGESTTPTLELRLERHAGELGWQVHRRIRLAPGQIGALRDALNLMDPDARDTRHPGRQTDRDDDATDNVIELTTLRRHSS